MPSIVPDSVAITMVSDQAERIHVAVAVIENAHQQVLIAKRPAHVHQGDLWEFPGGKVETGELVSEALARELYEELGVTVARMHPLIQIRHDYADRKVLLDVYRVEAFSGTAHGKEGQQVQWVKCDALFDWPMPEANLPITRALQLPQRYLITPAESSNATVFVDHLESCLQAGISLLQYRDSEIDAQQYLVMAQRIIDLANHYNAQVMLNCPLQLFHQCQGAGLHLTSASLMGLVERPVPVGVYLSASCHDAAEVQQANKIGVDFIVVAPVLPTRSHPDAKLLGWQQFELLTALAQMPVYALGGLNESDIRIAQTHGAQGIAAIRSLWGDGV